MINHYFSQEEVVESNPQIIQYQFGSYNFTFVTDTGVFSLGKMDGATAILLKNIPPLEGSLLDMGCGYGCIGIILAKEYGLDIVQADVNPRAVRLAAENAARNNVASEVVQSDHFSGIQGLFNTIVINPPIHAGKNVIFNMYEGACKHLKPGGRLFIVIYKKHGAESSIKRLIEIFDNCEVIYKKKGCYILCSRRL